MATEIDELQISIKASANEATNSLNELVKQLEALEQALNVVASGKSITIPSKLKQIGKSSSISASGLNQITQATRNATNSFNDLSAGLSKAVLGFSGLKGIFESIESAMDYVETSNFFNVSLGQISKQFEVYGYRSAEDFTETISKSFNELNQKMTGYVLGESGEALFSGNVGLGLNIEELMSFQAKTLSVTNSVGLFAEASTQATKALSMLASDLSSLTNTELDSVMQSLSSGLIGQSRALYKFGIDITNNTLQQYALAEGIKKSVTEMTQSEKMQLRLLAILDQSQVAWGDLANTVNSVANQHKISEQQIANLGRTIGNLFLPVVEKVLPYVNGLTIAVNNLLTSFGFRIFGDSWLEDLQNGISGGIVQDGLEDMEDSANSTTTAINKLKKSIRAFDELNVISSSSLSFGSTEAVFDELKGTIDLTESITTALKDYETVWNEALANAENKASEIAKTIQKNLEGIVSVFYDFDDSRTTVFADVLGGFVASLLTLKTITGIPSMIEGITGAFDRATASVTSINNISKSFDSLKEAGSNLLTALGGAGFTKALAVSGLVGLTATLTKLYFDLANLKYDGSAIDSANTRLKTSVDNLLGLKDRIETNFSSIGQDTSSAKKAVQAYFNLLEDDTIPSKDKLTTLQNYVQYIIDKFPELGTKVDANTGLFIANKQAILDDIDALSSYAKQVAAQDILTDAYKQLFDAQARFSELSDEYDKLRRKGQTELYFGTNLFKSTEFAKDLYETKKNLTEYGSVLEEAEKYVKQVENIARGSLVELPDFNVPVISDQISKNFELATQSAQSYVLEVDKINEASKQQAESLSLVQQAMRLYVPDIGLTENAMKELENNTSSLNNALSNVSLTIPNVDETVRQMEKGIVNATNSIDLFASATNLSAVNVDSLKAVTDDMANKLSPLSDISILVAEDMNKLALTTKTSEENFSLLGKSANTIREKYLAPLNTFIDQLNKNEIRIPYNTELEKKLDKTSEVAKNLKTNLDNLNKLNIDIPVKLNLQAKSLEHLNPFKNINFEEVALGGYALGGFPNEGSLFMARENGITELVGNFGGRTGVANNQQIIDGIRQAAYEGFKMAMAEQRGVSSATNVNVTLEPNTSELFKVIRKEENEYYQRTGNLAFLH